MDVTEIRPPLFTNRKLVSLTIPVLFDAMLAILVGMVDSAMVSSAGEAAVSAVSLVDSLNWLFLSVFSAIGVGGSVVTAQYIGSRNHKSASDSANQLIYLVSVISTGCMLLLLCFRRPVLQMIYGGVAPDVFENAERYFFFTLLGYPLYSIGAASAAILRAMGKNRQAVSITIAANLCNVVGNATLIYGFHMGAAGAGLSTTLCRIVYAGWGLILIHSKKFPVRCEKLLRFRLDFSMIKRVLRIGITNGLESGLFQVGKLLIASLVSSFGTVFIAANAVAFTINNIGWTTVSSFGTVLLTVVGQCIGAGQPEQAKAYTKKFLIAGTCTKLVLFSTIFLLRHQIVQLYSFGEEALDTAAYYIGVCALATMFAGYSLSFVPTNAFRAAGDIRYPITLSVYSMFALRVALCYLLNALFPSLGLMCVYLGMAADWALRAVLNVLRFRSGKWLKKALI